MKSSLIKEESGVDREFKKVTRGTQNEPNNPNNGRENNKEIPSSFKL